MNTDIAYRFIGTPGSFVVADVPVPARDIQEWEVMQDPALKAAIEENLATSGPCFERVPLSPRKMAKATTDEVTDKAK